MGGNKGNLVKWDLVMHMKEKREFRCWEFNKEK